MPVWQHADWERNVSEDSELAELPATVRYLKDVKTSSTSSRANPAAVIVTMSI